MARIKSSGGVSASTLHSIKFLPIVSNVGSARLARSVRVLDSLIVLILCHFNPVLNLRSVFGLKSFDEAAKLVYESSYPLKEELLNSLMPAIRLSTSRIESAELAFGSSRMGGHPDMPLSLDWPVYSPAKDNQGSCELLTKPLDFIAQINLQEITGFVGSEVLPATGFRYVFFARSAGAHGGSAKELRLKKLYFY